MSDLVEKLRATADDTDAVDNSSVSYLLEDAAEEIERLRLTDVEREAVQRAVKDETDFGFGYTADALQSLLDRLSRDGDCPAPDNGTNADTVGRTLARRITGLKSTLEEHWVAAERADSEYRAEIAILRSDNSRRADLEVGLREGVEQLQVEVRRLESVIAATQPTLTDEEREAVEHAADLIDAKTCGDSSALRSLLERLK